MNNVQKEQNHKMYMQEKNSNSRKDKKQTPMEGIAGTATLS